MTKMNHRLDGFSLVELLVSLAVVAILAGILIPVIYQGIEKAQSSTCVSNLRQCYAAIQNYAMDNNGEYPPPQMQANGSDTWGLRIVPYYSDYAMTYSGMKKAPHIQVCPTHKDRIHDVTGNYFLTYYSMNYKLGPSTSFPTRPIKTLASIEVPSKTLLLTESGFNSSTTVAVADGYWLARSPRYENGYVGGVHDGSNNVLWCDGSVSAFPDIIQLTNFLPTY